MPNSPIAYCCFVQVNMQLIRRNVPKQFNRQNHLLQVRKFIISHSLQQSYNFKRHQTQKRVGEPL
ncbi:hypothetical protein T11_2957, partial [Trichinella zimbabwensis]